ncbi:uncharacterized protein LOC129618445 isoform X2 [Condylostylus longicornis]|uniref:uncharacterized protein LOC129618445 isoform X2 n=1 Tax=Condylostylus longicornis TaxID=2530218 RepID=UPI00244D9EFC|nr:uncharacterized protein LOC129618445 isoform X2 [Condylostylus longicornis]
MSWERTKCVIKHCQATKKKFPELRFFEFPKRGTERYLKWLCNAGDSCPNIEDRKRPYICSRHFESYWMGKKWLRRDACPTIFSEDFKFNPQNANKTYERRSIFKIQEPRIQNDNANATHDSSVEDQVITSSQSDSSSKNLKIVKFRKTSSDSLKNKKSVIFYVRQIKKLKKILNELTLKIKRGKEVLKYSFRHRDALIRNNKRENEEGFQFQDECSSDTSSNSAKTGSKIPREVKKVAKSSQIPKIQTEKNDEFQVNNECLVDIGAASQQNEIDPLSSIKEEIEETSYSIEENLNLPSTSPEVTALKACEQNQDFPVKIELESLDDPFQTNECLVNVNNPLVANEIDPLISVKDEIEEKPNLPEGGSSDGEERKRRQSDEPDKNVDCGNCKKFKEESDFYKKEYLSMKEKCSQILERVKSHAVTMESIVQSNKFGTTELNNLNTGKIKLAEKVKENEIKLLKQIETLKAELHVFKYTKCSLKVLKNNN